MIGALRVKIVDPDHMSQMLCLWVSVYEYWPLNSISLTAVSIKLLLQYKIELLVCWRAVKHKTKEKIIQITQKQRAEKFEDIR